MGDDSKANAHNVRDLGYMCYVLWMNTCSVS